MRKILIALAVALISINMNDPANIKPTIIYVYDPMCGWCYGFSKVMNKLYDEKQNEYDFDIISGGMVLGPNEGYLSKEFSEYILQAYKRVEDLSGVKYGEAYLNHLRNYSLWTSSLTPSLALETIKILNPKQAYSFASLMQYAHFYEGKNLSDSNTYTDIILKYQLDISSFNQHMKSEAVNLAALNGFETSQKLGINGYPCVLVKNDQGKYFKVANGFTDYHTLLNNIQKALKK